MFKKIFKKEDTSKNKFGRMAKRDPYEDMLMLLKKINIQDPIILDGGVSRGGTIKIFKKWFPDSFIFGFEPIAELVQDLKKNNKHNDVEFFQYALGEKNEQKNFNINQTSATSSFFQPDIIKKYHSQKVELSKKIEVEVVAIDDLVNEKKIKSPDIIKLDLQGGELDALRGAQKTLLKVKIVYTEVEFISLYKDQPLFADIADFLKENNFSLFNLYDLYTHNDGQLTAGDAIFINHDFYV